MSDLAPDVRAVQPILGSETCGCCDGVEPSTPVQVANRSGLSAIAYRIGGYTEFRESLHAGLSSSAHAALARLLTRDDDDFTIGLLDAFACAADVLTFYQERIANESYLRTATERVSLQELGRLIGYRLRPGVAAETWLAFALETPPTPPPNLPPDPGAFVTGVPSQLTLEPGLKVQSVPGPDEKPQVFETVEAIEARPQWNAMRPWLSVVLRPGRDARVTYLAGIRNNLRAGDGLVFLGDEFLANRASDNWDFRVIDSVEIDPANDRTRVSWTRGLGSLVPWSDPATQNPQVHVLRKRAAAYGHNAPKWKSMPAAFRTDYASGSGLSVLDQALTIQAPLAIQTSDSLSESVVVSAASQDEWPSFTISPRGATANGGFVDLDALYPEVHSDGYVVMAKGDFNSPVEPTSPSTYVELYTVDAVAEESRSEFALSGKVTRLELRGENYNKFAGFVRQTSVFVQSEPLTFARAPIDTPVTNDRVPVEAIPDGLEPGRALLIRGARVSDGVTVVHQATLTAAQADANGSVLHITPPLPSALVRRSVVVHGNVALATHGETVGQILGQGDAARTFQRFELKQGPLTYRAAGTETGAASALVVRVNDIKWEERVSMFGAGPADRGYTVETDEQGRRFVQFGDGVRGARLPVGANNVRATYRKGLGIEGNVEAEKLTQLMTRPLGLKGVSNPREAEGGTDPESADDARQTIPLGTRTLGRAVSLLDYEDFARAFTGVAKAQAAELRPPAGPTIAVTIAGPLNTVLSNTNPVWQSLLTALRASGEPHVRLVLLPHQASTFRVGLKVKCDPAHETKTVLAGVEAALRAHFAFESRQLAQPVHQSEVVAVAHSAPGVLAVDLDLLYGGTQPSSQTIPSRQTRLLASRMRVSGVTVLPAELLTLDPAPFDRLEVMP